MADFNPNWVAFAASQAKAPEQLPAGPSTNAAFMAWISEQSIEFTACTGISKETHPGDFAELFSEWLTDAYPAEAEPDEPDYHTLWEMAHPVLPHPYYDGGRLVRPGAGR